MTLDSILDDMEVLESQLESVCRHADQFSPTFELLDCALKAQRFARATLQRCEVYEDGPSEDECNRRDDLNQRAREAVIDLRRQGLL